jgi:hypothetical protein
VYPIRQREDAPQRVGEPVERADEAAAVAPAVARAAYDHSHGFGTVRECA